MPLLYDDFIETADEPLQPALLVKLWLEDGSCVVAAALYDARTRQCLHKSQSISYANSTHAINLVELS